MKLNGKIFGYLKNHGATILSIAAAAGVVLTAVETAKATTKAQSLIDMNKAEPMTKKEVVQDCWKYYIPAAVVGAGTVACILGSNCLNKKTQKELMAAYVAVQQTYSAYRRKVAEQVGKETEKDIHEQTMLEAPKTEDGDVIRLFYDSASERYFHATMAQVIEAAYRFNKKLAIDGCVSVNEWCDFLGTDELTITPEGDSKGWCIDQLIEDWDYYWMDFEYDKQTTDDGLECYYYAPFLDPVENYLNYDENRALREKSCCYYEGGETNGQKCERLEDSRTSGNHWWRHLHDVAGLCRGEGNGREDQRSS